MKRTVRTNRWHAVTVIVERNEGELDIRINSMPDEGTHISAYLTPAKALKLASVLVEAARFVATRNRKESTK